MSIMTFCRFGNRSPAHSKGHTIEFQVTLKNDQWNKGVRYLSLINYYYKLEKAEVL